MGKTRHAITMVMASLMLSSPLYGKLAAVKDDNRVTVTIDGEVFTEYRFAEAARPFFYPVIAPTGDNITRHWPMEAGHPDEERDHEHHRSLWFTHGDVNGHDFWTEGRGPRIVQTELVVESQANEVVIATGSEWRAKDGKVVCTDVRRHTIRDAGGNRTIDFKITLKASHGRITLGDTKEGSMAFRVAPTLRVKGKVAAGHILNSEGMTDGDAWGKCARWCDYYGPLKGKTVGIAIMDHRDNPRHPTTWHARDYGLGCANPFGLSAFLKKPKGAGDMVIEDGKSATFKYRVLIHGGAPQQADMEARYQAYIQESR